MKKLLSFALAAAMLLGLAACGGGGSDAAGSAEPSADVDSPAVSTQPAADPTATPSAEPTAEPTATPAPEPNPAYELTYVEGFVDGWAYIEFRDTETRDSYRGVIDTDGKLHAYYNSRNISASYSVGSGRFYGWQDKDHFVISPDGKTHIYPEVQEIYNDNTFSGGYRYVTERKSGFDAVEYVTHIYGPDGSELTSFSGNQSTYYYADNGVFVFPNDSAQTPESSYNMFTADLYFAQSNTWLKEQAVNRSGYGIRALQMGGGIFVFRCSSNNGRYEMDNGEVCYADAKGNVQTITFPAEYSEEPYYLCAADGILLFTDTKGKALYCYNTKTSQWAAYQGSYQDNISDITYVAAGDSHFALPLRGADGKAYWVLLNEKLEDLTEPALGTVRAISDGAVYVENSGLECRDFKGNLLSSFRYYWNQSSNYTYLGFDDGIVCVTSDDKDNNRPRGYYKPDGTLAFEIDLSTGIEAKLPS